MKFFVGLHIVSHAQHFQGCMVSVNRLRDRKSDFVVRDWLLDSGAFTEISRHGEYRDGPEEYVDQINRWSRCGNLIAAAAQDYMCEPFILERTGMAIPEHQARTIDRYERMVALRPAAPIMPVLQGWKPGDYVTHLRAYGGLIQHDALVGVGSVCKRNTNVQEIEEVLTGIHAVRPDIRLHGFGLKLTALTSPTVRRLLWSSDSMAWSFAARVEGRGPDANKWEEAKKYVDKVESILEVA